MNIGDNIKYWRKSKKITQKQLAKLINKGDRTIQKYESGEIIPPMNVISEIANVLHISTSDLIKTDMYLLEKNLSDKIKERYPNGAIEEINLIANFLQEYINKSVSFDLSIKFYNFQNKTPLNIDGMTIEEFFKLSSEFSDSILKIFASKEHINNPNPKYLIEFTDDGEET